MTWQRMENMILCAGRASVNASRMCSTMMACKGVGMMSVSARAYRMPLERASALDFTYIYAFLSDDLRNFGVFFDQFRKPEQATSCGCCRCRCRRSAGDGLAGTRGDPLRATTHRERGSRTERPQGWPYS